MGQPFGLTLRPTSNWMSDPGTGASHKQTAPTASSCVAFRRAGASPMAAILHGLGSMSRKKLDEKRTTNIQMSHSKVSAGYGNRIVQLFDGWIQPSVAA